MKSQLGILLIIALVSFAFAQRKFDCENGKAMQFVNTEILKLEKKLFYNCGNLRKLVMHNNNLSDIDSSSFQEVNNIRTLTISENAIKNLNGSLKYIPDLAEISLFGNKIEVIDKFFFYGTVKLRVINLSNNQIKSIDEHAFDNFKNLEALILIENKLIRLPEISADQIDVSFNEIEIIKIAKKTTTLDISNNKLKVIECPEVMVMNYLDASNNSLSDWTCLLKMDSLKYLSLRENRFSILPRQFKLRSL